MIPVIDLAAVAGCKPATGLNILLITEYARSVQAFAVESVENIMRLDWKQVHAAETAVSGRYITSIACRTRRRIPTIWRWCWTWSRSCTTSPRRTTICTPPIWKPPNLTSSWLCRDCCRRFESGALNAGEGIAGDGDPGPAAYHRQRRVGENHSVGRAGSG